MIQADSGFRGLPVDTIKERRRGKFGYSSVTLGGFCGKCLPEFIIKLLCIMLLRRLFLLGLFGLSTLITTTAFAAAIFPENTPWRYFKGTQEASSPGATAWRAVGFNDSGWLTGNAPFYYENSWGYSGNTELTYMSGGYSTSKILNSEGVRVLLQS
jgi:hypothetical protein